MTHRRTTRRQLLLLPAAVGAAVLIERLRPWSALVEHVPDPPAARLVGLLADPVSAREAGLEYLRIVPAERSPSTLAAAIANGIPGGLETVSGAGDAELRHLIGVSVREDFAHERTVALRGWILAATEARLLALAALAV